MTSSITLTAHDIIHKYSMIPHPEGGYYVETFRSDIIIPTIRGNLLTNNLTLSYKIYYNISY